MSYVQRYLNFRLESEDRQVFDQAPHQIIKLWFAR